MKHGTRGSEQFGLVMSARSRRIAAADGSVMDETDFHHEGRAQEISDWLVDDSKAFQAALEVAEEDLARQILENIFGIDANR